jgi:hypothetical protein
VNEERRPGLERVLRRAELRRVDNEWDALGSRLLAGDHEQRLVARTQRVAALEVPDLLRERSHAALLANGGANEGVVAHPDELPHVRQVDPVVDGR